MTVKISSFGYRNGTEPIADEVYDVWHLPNPYGIENLHNKTGNDPEVQSYVMCSGEAQILLDEAESEIQSGAQSIAFGCIGGKHRSVTLANKLYQRCMDLEIPAYVSHRDI